MIAVRGATATALLCLLAAPAAGQAPFSVDDVMSFSFASGLVAAPAGDRVAWIENREGERNVWVAEGPAWEGRPLTSYRGDDGQELGGLTFSPDGNRVFWVRGGAPNRQGEVPDPLSTPDEEGRAVWVSDFTGGDATHLVDTGNFTISPNGAHLAYSSGREIFLLALGAETDVERIARIRGSAGSLTWSPDGSKLGFVSGRGDHAFIGVLDLSDRVITYLDPSVATDGSPAWSPDGRQIAFLRIPNERVVHMFSPRREGLPFSIRVADVRTGEGREVWKANDGLGSAFSGVNASTQLWWAAGDRLIFPWEGDGWKHLYSVPVSGGDAISLTPGDFEVQFAAISPDRESMIYDSNQDDIDRKHVWRASVNGDRPEPITSGTGVEWGAVMTEGGTIAFHAASGSEPAHTVVLHDGERHRVSPTRPASFPAARMVEPEQVVFSASDGMQIHGQLFLPPGASSGEKHPAVVFFHGGSRRQMLLGFHHRGYYHNTYAMNQMLANAGYVVLSVNYRSGIGYGMEFREAENYGATGASEFNDVMGSGLYLRSRPDVDPDRIGLWGGSYGGYLTALGLARASHLFAAGVDIHGVHDWNVVMNGFRPSYEPEDYPEFSQLAYDSSPMAFMDGWTSPVLLIHGDDDRNVPFSETVDVAEALDRRGVEYEQLIFPDEVHGFLLHRNWVAAFDATLSFFDRKLKQRPAS
ncbi:MAG: prolyl oligopeptidase family serine peptidase [Gemmatimonadota bacterium]|nr:prolyl oligopeptidase family serine peptidase [Gemmatimonadota bacterium]MDE3005184.1 prolyl oligopeptidase family serine peptidase [Gemmatimonadota bacterium]MDE3013413.1 prolyl oligopeptidase family serine peptidase [Gemmatimonadota bacterium]